MINCAVCDQDKPITLLEKNNYSLVMCSNDLHMYVRNPPSAEELAKIYSEDYFRGRGAVGYRHDVFENRAKHQRKAERKLSRVKQFTQEGSLLDVGCGPGFFLKAAQPDFEIEGVDISRAAAGYAMREFGIPVHIGDFMKFSVDNRYDVITMFSYLEHTLSPRENLEKANTMLSDNGLLVLALPNAQGITAQILGKKWRGFEIPEHINFLNQSNLEALLRETGYEPLKSQLKDNHFFRDTIYYYARKK